jgi:hypothetical protein
MGTDNALAKYFMVCRKYELASRWPIPVYYKDRDLNPEALRILTSNGFDKPVAKTWQERHYTHIMILLTVVAAPFALVALLDHFFGGKD